MKRLMLGPERALRAAVDDLSEAMKPTRTAGGGLAPDAGAIEAALVALDALVTTQSVFARLTISKSLQQVAFLVRSTAHQRLGNPAAAEAVLDEAVARFGWNQHLRQHMGNTLAKSGRHHDALACYERGLADWPDNPSLLLGRARMLIELARYEDAIPVFQMALDRGSAPGPCHVGLTKALAATGQTDAAIGACETALAHDTSGRAGLWLILARLYRDRRDWPSVIATLDRALDAGVSDRTAIDAARAEAKRQQHTGSAEVSSSYYDDIYAKSEAYAAEAEESIYAPSWAMITGMITKLGLRNVLDFGCGPGQFAAYLLSHAKDIRYTGLDFSAVAIEQASARCPDGRFDQRALPLESLEEFAPVDVVICTEVLEHIEHDLDVIAALPVGTRFIGSVPNFDSYGHVRVFTTEDEVTARYGPMFPDLAVTRCALRGSSCLWVFSGVRG
ncbi:MAG: methyltransferase [Pseudomonadota bacterium]